MHTLQRHIFLSVLLTCAAATGLFAFVLMTGNALRDLLGYALAGQLTPGELTRLVLLLFPFVLSYALPMGLLTGVLLVLGRMSAQQEVTAMRAAGLGLGYLARPVLLLGALGTLLALATNYVFLPQVRVAYHQLLGRALQQNPLGFIQPKTFVRNFPDVVFYVREKQGNLVKDVWVWRLDPQQRAREFIHAQAGRVDYDPAANTLQLTLSGNVMADRRNPQDPESFANTDLLLVSDTAPFPPWKLNELFGAQTAFHIKQAWLSLDELLAERARLAAEPPTSENALSAMRLQITLNEKGASALAAFSLTLLAVPLGIRVSRKETSANLAVAIFCALGYYFLTVMVGWLNNQPALRPDLLLWVPNLILLAVGTTLFWRLDRR